VLSLEFLWNRRQLVGRKMSQHSIKIFAGLSFFLGCQSIFAAPPAAPSDFAFARSDASNAATLTWVDNASDETLHQFEITAGGGAPFVQDIVGADATSITFTGFVPGTEYGFRMRSAKPLAGGGADELEVSDWTDSVIVVTRDLTFESAPLSGKPGVSFSSRPILDFEPDLVEFEEALPAWLTWDENEFVFSASDPPIGDFTVTCTASSGVHFRETSLIMNFRNQFLSSAVTATPGEDFTYQLEADFVPDEFQLDSALPTWLAFDEASWIFTGVNPPEGSFKVSFSGTTEGITQRGFVYFNVINVPPTANGEFEPLVFDDLAPVDVDLSSVFSETDFIRAAAVDTDFGVITFGFYEGFPVTVDNFFAYANNGDWDGAFFHRMAKLGNGENFVLQGGGFKPGAEEGSFERVNQLDPIVNEFDASRPNICGTISMAKLGGNPDSATNQFFISLNDNRAILDGQNGGFTVFGRAADIQAANRMSALPRSTFTAEFGTNVTSFSDWPLKEISADSAAFDELATMNQVREIPTLNYTVTLEGDEVVTTSVAPIPGAPLVVTPNGQFGQAILLVEATDLDGSSVTSSFPVTVRSEFATWAAFRSVPATGADSDGGGMSNFEEYLYGGDPNSSLDDAGLLPQASLSDDGKGGLRFRHRTFSTDLGYVVEMSNDLEQWEILWETSDGFEAPQVGSATKEGEVTILNVQDDETVSTNRQLYFRLRGVKEVGE